MDDGLKAAVRPVDAASPRLGSLDLEAHMRDPSRKQAFVTPMFDVIAPRYDDFTRLFSFGMDAGWKRAVVEAALASHDGVSWAPRTALDLAAGTGDIAVALLRAAPDLRAVALDASPRMVEQAQLRRAALSPDRLPDRSPEHDLAARWQITLGDMSALDIPDASMDLVTAGYGLRNVPDAEVAVREVRRVLRPGGRLVLLDFYRPDRAVWRRLLLWYLSAAGNLVGWWWHRDPVVYGYIARSIDHFISWQACSSMLASNGFRVTRVVRYLGGGVARHEAIAID